MARCHHRPTSRRCTRRHQHTGGCVVCGVDFPRWSVAIGPSHGGTAALPEETPRHCSRSCCLLDADPTATMGPGADSTLTRDDFNPPVQARRWRVAAHRAPTRQPRIRHDGPCRRICRGEEPPTMAGVRLAQGTTGGVSGFPRVVCGETFAGASSLVLISNNRYWHKILV
jgi:hypothetical protein